MRKDKLMASGFEETEADESLSLYENLDDNAFEAIVAMYKKKMAKMEKKSEFKENLTKDEKNESTNPKAAVVASEETTEEVTETLFDGVSSTEAALVDASDANDELQSTRASVAQWLTENVLRK
jgi:asparagine synthetase B (glutamine-hydrolysing)